MDVRECSDLVELYAGRAGVDKDAIDRTLILKMINAKLAEVLGTTFADAKVYTGTTAASTYEYDLPDNVVPFEVELDGEVLDECSWTEAWKWRYDG